MRLTSRRIHVPRSSVLAHSAFSVIAGLQLQTSDPLPASHRKGNQQHHDRAAMDISIPEG